LDEEERSPPIVGAATGEVGFAEFWPEDVMKVPAVRREADDLPTGVLAKCLTDIGVFRVRCFIETFSGNSRRMRLDFALDSLAVLAFGADQIVVQLVGGIGLKQQTMLGSLHSVRATILVWFDTVSGPP